MMGESQPTEAPVDSQPSAKKASLPSACTHRVSVCTRRDLPKPGSPMTRTTWPIPSCACSHRSFSKLNSVSRPVRGVNANCVGTSDSNRSPHSGFVRASLTPSRGFDLPASLKKFTGSPFSGNGIRTDNLAAVSFHVRPTTLMWRICSSQRDCESIYTKARFMPILGSNWPYFLQSWCRACLRSKELEIYFLGRREIAL